MLKLLFTPLNKLIKRKKVNDKKPIDPENLYFNNTNDVISWLQQGYKIMQDQAEEWAKILTIDLSKMFITFNLSIIAFWGASVIFSSGIEIKNHALIYYAITCAFLSIFILSILVWIVTRTNLNTSTERVEIIRNTLTKISNNEKDSRSYYEENMQKVINKIRKVELYHGPMQRIGIYLFLASVLSSLLNIFIIIFQKT